MVVRQAKTVDFWGLCSRFPLFPVYGRVLKSCKQVAEAFVRVAAFTVSCDCFNDDSGYDAAGEEDGEEDEEENGRHFSSIL